MLQVTDKALAELLQYRVRLVEQLGPMNARQSERWVGIASTIAIAWIIGGSLFLLLE